MGSPDLETQLARSVFHVQQQKKAKALQMTNAIEKANQQQSRQLAPVANEWESMVTQAEQLLASGFLPKAIRTAPQALAIMQTGKELGLGPMQALRSIHIIEGKPTMSADLIAGLALAKVPGSKLRVVESTNEVCRIEAGRSGELPTPFSFTIADAKNAGLLGKDNWRKYPRAMLRARCMTEACRAIFPDAVMGLYDPDELGAVTDAGGRVVVEQVSEITPHAAPGEDQSAPDKPSDEFDGMMSYMEQAHKWVFDPGCDWERMTSVRSQFGTKAAPTPFSKRLSELYRGDALSANQRKRLSQLWQSIERKLTALEGKLKPPPVEASYTDEPEDGTEAFAAQREPGDDSEEDVL